ncbi:unnamed protein product [Caenorhabditis brenneri]
MCSCLTAYSTSTVSPSVSTDLYSIPVYLPKEDQKTFISRCVGLKKSLEEVDALMTQEYGESAMEYTAMEYWYYYFRNNRKTSSSEPDEFKFLDVASLKSGRSDVPPDPELSKHLLDFEDKILKKILVDKYLDTRDRLVLHQVCHRFRKYFPEHDRIIKVHVYVDVHNVSLKFNDNTPIVYSSTDSGICKVQKTLIRGPNYVDLAIQDLTMVLINPVYSFKSLEMHFYGREKTKVFLRKLRAGLESSMHQIRIKKFSINWCTVYDIIYVLPYLKVGFLESIGIIYINESKKNLDSLKKLCRSKQWMNAKSLCIQFTLFKLAAETHQECFWHFKNLEFSHTFRSSSDVPFIKTILKLYPNIEYLKIISKYDLKILCAHLSQLDAYVTEDKLIQGKAALQLSTIQKQFRITCDTFTRPSPLQNQTFSTVEFRGEEMFPKLLKYLMGGTSS